MRTKLTPDLISQIHQRRRDGAGYEALAGEFGVSQGSIRNALKVAPEGKRETPAPRSAPMAPALELEAPPTQEDVRRWLGEQVTSLRQDAESFRREGDAPALERCNRALVNSSALLARITPAPPSEELEGKVLVPAGEMTAFGARVETELQRMVDLICEDADKGPKCPTCSRPIIQSEGP